MSKTKRTDNINEDLDIMNARDATKATRDGLEKSLLKKVKNAIEKAASKGKNIAIIKIPVSTIPSLSDYLLSKGYRGRRRNVIVRPLDLCLFCCREPYVKYSIWWSVELQE